MRWYWKTLIWLATLGILFGGIVLSIILFTTIRNAERDAANEELRLSCDAIAGYTSSKMWATVTLMITLVEMIRRSGWIGQQPMELILSRMTALPWESIGMAELQLIPGSNISNWQDYNKKQVTTVDPNTFEQTPLPINRDWYLPLTSCVPCANAIGLDYFGEYYRAELVQRAIDKNSSAISYPIQTSTVTSTGQTVRALVFFTPFFNESNNDAFEGGVSSSYDSESLLPRNETGDIQFKMVILGTTVLEDPGYASTTLKHDSSFIILDQQLDLFCGKNFSHSFSSFIVLLLGIFLSLLVPFVILLSWFMGRRQRRQDEALMEAREEQNAASLREQAASLREQSAVAVGNLKSSFLATMSHEIRTPINGVLGMTDFLLDTDLSEVQKDFAQTIKDSAKSLLSIINDILDFSKIEAGKLLVEKIDFDLMEMVRSFHRTLGPIMQKNNNQLVIRHNLPTVAFVKTDPNRLRQILNNLLSNSAKFTHNGIITIIMELPQQEGDMIHFAVKDTGIGMSEETVRNLFQAFSQADASTTRKYGGTGLGLNISKRLVELLGGEIWTDSVEGNGSTFHFTVPYVKGNPPAETQKRTSAFKGSGTILAVDDNATNLKIATGILKKLGFTTIKAVDGEDAIKVYNENKADVRAIMMDCQMPIMDGYTATRKLREMGVVVPIIAMTASVMQEEKDRCIASGMNDFIGKPMFLETVSDVLQKYL